MEELALENLQIEHPGKGVVRVVIDRQEQLNALNDATVAEIEQVFLKLAQDRSVRVVIVTGAGPKAFVAGADIQELAEQSGEEAKQRASTGQRAFDAIEQCGKPVIAQINGFALGGGCELALACHLRYASSRAKIGLPEVTLGIIPGYGGTQRLPRIVGRGRALELILTGNHVGAEQAKEIGLVNDVCEPEELDSMVLGIAETICKRGPLALANAIEAVTRGGDETQAEGLAIEADLFGATSETEDMREGMQAFLNKRSPEFHGR